MAAQALHELAPAGGRQAGGRARAKPLTMRTINLIAVHCTATLAGRPFDVAAIRAMHKARGFTDIGYHKLIGIAGEIWDGRPIEVEGNSPH